MATSEDMEGRREGMGGEMGVTERGQEGPRLRIHLGTLP